MKTPKTPEPVVTTRLAAALRITTKTLDGYRTLLDAEQSNAPYITVSVSKWTGKLLLQAARESTTPDTSEDENWFHFSVSRRIAA